MTDFSVWYDQYPKKVARKDAERAWSKLTLPQRQMALDALPAHLHRWRMTATNWEYLPHAATWLNGQRFLDEIPNGAGTSRGSLTEARNAGIGENRAPPSNGPAVTPSATIPGVLPAPVVTAGPPSVRLSTGPVELGAVFAGLRQQLKRSGT